jgi:hypothetical protein
MAYGIMTFIGDFPVAGQSNWDITFVALDNAINAAKEQHANFNIEGNDNEHYTIVLDLEKDEEDDIMWLIYKDEIKEGMKAQEVADTLAYGEVP